MSAIGDKGIDSGTGYGRPRPTWMRELTEVMLTPASDTTAARS